MIPSELLRQVHWSAWVGKPRNARIVDPINKQAVRRVRLESEVSTTITGADGDPVTTTERVVGSALVDVDNRHCPEWLSHGDAKAMARRIVDDPELKTPHGCGECFMLTGTPYVVVDLDDCVADGEITNDFVKGIVDQLDSYTEISSSGTGLHVVVKTKPLARKRFSSLLKIELLWFGHHVTLTGDSLHGTPKPIAERTEEVLKIGKEELGWE